MPPAVRANVSQSSFHFGGGGKGLTPSHGEKIKTDPTVEYRELLGTQITTPFTQKGPSGNQRDWHT